jgi:ribonuclease HI
MPSKNYTYIYTDGGAEKWAFVVVQNNSVIYEESGVSGLKAVTCNDDTESEAILQALRYAKDRPANYLLTTDSQAVIAKVKGSVANATKNPNIPGIQALLRAFKESPFPISFELKWEKRLSNEFMKRADFLCS